jgi:outer membrane protein OmpA-like peptidoglycan-associated protein
LARFLLLARPDREQIEARHERRASAVRDYMRALGLNSSRISITSVGEEMANGTDEASWARDRHVAASAE